MRDERATGRAALNFARIDGDGREQLGLQRRGVSNCPEQRILDRLACRALNDQGAVSEFGATSRDIILQKARLAQCMDLSRIFKDN